MNPDFEKYRPVRGADLVQLNVRVDPRLKRQLELIASIEDDGLGALVTEGIARVIEDRGNNSEYLESRRATLLAELSMIEEIQSDTQS